MNQLLPTEENLRTTSRDLLKVYKYALDHPEKKLISSRRFGKILGLEGRALGGVLAGSQKTNHVPILIRQGVIKTSWSGKYESRQQLWSINPELSTKVRKLIKSILNQMFLDKNLK